MAAVKTSLSCNSFSDHVKLCNNKYLDPDYTAYSLQRKVQFDIHLQLSRHGCKNMEKMKEDDFKLLFDQKQEIWYLIKNRDELTKNHKEIGSIVSGVMPENCDDHLCPIRSYRKYIDHLNPENEYLWQLSLKNVNYLDPQVWYGKQHLGKHTLGKFMSEISLNCHLSKMYMNHSI